MKFFIVDVFAVEEKYTGNQLAVFTNAANISERQMQRIAKEINYSETTFILDSAQREGGYDVRIFTPEQELPFAGHPTLGTAYVIGQEVIKQPVQEIILNLKIGQIPVTLNRSDGVDWLWMQQKTPTFTQSFSAETMAEVLNLELDEIDSRFPIKEVSTGVPFIITPLKTQSSLKRIKVNKDKYFQLINTTQAKSLLAFCPETYNSENDLSVRVFADYLGVPEDPATGSANGCLAGYLIQFAYFSKEEINLRVEQGYEVGRPSLLLLKAQKKDGQIEVFVGGKVMMIAKGEFV